MSQSDPNPLVGIIMGSQSDWETMEHAHDTLHALGVPHEVRIVSAHRTPDRMSEYAKTAKSRGLKVQYWTINERKEMRDLMARGADGIMTDYMDRFAQAR